MLNFIFEGGIIFSILYILSNVQAVLGDSGTYGIPNVLTATAGIGFLVSLTFIGSIRPAGAKRFPREALLFILFCAIVGALAYFIGTTVPASSTRSATTLIARAAIAIPLVVLAWRSFTLRFKILGGYRERILILGTGETAKEACRSIKTMHSSSHDVVGFVCEYAERLGEPLAMGTRIHTTYDQLLHLSNSKVDKILVALDEKRGKFPLEALMRLRMSGMKIQESTSFFEKAAGKIDVGSLLPSWIIFSDGFKISPLRVHSKRLFDLVASLILLILTAPVMLLTALLVFLDHGPAFYTQERTGLHGATFKIYKFRSMVVGAEDISGPTWTKTNDARVTWIGRIIRKFRIDELPQLFNVLKGEMSFIGPRPERPTFAKQLEAEIPYFRLRLSTPPGITGWAQVNYGYGATVEENREKLKYDLFYIKNMNPFLDLVIVFRTIRVVLSGSGAK